MQVLLLFPLAFIAGMDGFAIFTPYLLLIVIAGHLIQRRRRAALARSAAARNQLPVAADFEGAVPVLVRA
ncbi:MAG: hypothetical protein JWL69_4196 [Phycisphaerales bacterium]|nr:hypothetical protein [Phycisphaerales bacterium]